MHAGKLRVWGLFMLINLAGFSLLGLAYFQGAVHEVVEGDVSYITLIIPLLFLMALTICYKLIRETNRIYDDLAARKGLWLKRYREVAQRSEANANEQTKTKLFRRLIPVKMLLWSFPVLGLLGTVIGTKVAFAETALADKTELTEIGMSLVTQMVGGIGVALNTTLVGMLFMIWLYVNETLLRNESARVYEQILEAGVMKRRQPKPAPATPATPEEHAVPDSSGG